MDPAEVVILETIPCFSGNVRPQDVQKPGAPVDIKTFLRSLDNYFERQGISDDETKLRIMHSRISKSYGDAIENFAGYSGKVITYAEVKAEFSLLYSAQRRTDFKTIASNLLETKFSEHTLAADIRRLEVLTRMLTESYLEKSSVKALGLSHSSPIGVGTDSFGKPLIAAIPTSIPLSAATDKTAKPGSAPQAGAGSGIVTTGIVLEDCIQNVLIHSYLSPHVPYDHYSRVDTIAPDTKGTMFKARLTHELELKQIMSTPKGNTIPEVCYLSQSKNAEREKAPKVDSQGESNQRKCYSCGKTGHVRRECRVFCLFCKRSAGHWTKNCDKRKKANIPYCANCNVLSHNTENCRNKRDKPPNKPKYPPHDSKRSVNVISEFESPDIEEESD